MNRAEIIQSIDEELARLKQVRNLLGGQAPQKKRGRPAGSKSAVKPQRKKMSAEIRARIAAAQKARWAKTRER